MIEVALSAVNARQADMRGPIIGILLRVRAIHREGFFLFLIRLQLPAVEVKLLGRTFLQRFIAHGNGVVVTAHGLQNARLVQQIVVSLLGLDRLVFVFQSFIQINFGGEEVVGGIVPAFPIILVEAANLPVNAGRDELIHIYRNLERHGDLFPTHGNHGRIRLEFVEVVGQCIVHVGRLRFHRHAERIFVLLVAEAAPCGRHLRKNHRPLIFAGNHVQSVGSFVERLALNGHGIGKRDRRILVGSCAPYFSIRHQLAPNLPAVSQRAVIVNGDIGDANALRDLRMLALQR